MQITDRPTRCPSGNEYRPFATREPDAAPDMTPLARSSTRASAIAPLTPGTSQLITIRRNTQQDTNRRESRQSEQGSDGRRIASRPVDADGQYQKIESPARPEQRSRETLLQSLRSARAPEESSRKRARLESRDNVDEITAAESSRKGGGASEGDLAAEKPRPSATWRHSVTGEIFTARIQAGSLSDGGERTTGVQRGASRRVLLRYDMTWGELDGILIESANMFKLGRRWTARYQDLDGDWIMLRNEHDLLPFLLVAEESVIQARNNRDQIPLITIKLHDD